MEKHSRKEITANYKARKVTGGICTIKNTMSGKQLLICTANLQSRENRFAFSKKMNVCDDLKLKDDFNAFGIEAFVFEVLEELEKNETQTDKEFMADLKVLYDLWLEKIGSGKFY